MSDHFTADVEDPTHQEHRANNLFEFIQAGFLLAMWSVLMTIDGVVHLQHGAPSALDLFSCNGPNRFGTQFLGDLFEVIIGLFGLCVGLGGALLGDYNTTLTVIFIASQIVLGWYVFIDYVFLIPVFSVSKIIPHMIPGLSDNASRLISAMGIMTSISFWIALQGGQFVFIARLIAFSTERDFLKQRSCAKMHAIFWNLNVAFAGLWTILTVCVIIASIDAELTSQPILAPSSIHHIFVDLLTTGLIMFLWPLFGIMISVSGRMQMVRLYVVGSFFFFLALYLRYSVVHPGFIAAAPDIAGPAAGASVHIGLLMMITFLGPYFMLKQTQENTFIE